MSYFFQPNQQLQTMIDDFFAAVSRYNDAACSKKLSVLLLGSLSKGEGSWVDDENGAQMLSDIEFFVIYPADFTAVSDVKAELDRLIALCFSQQTSSLFHVDATFVSVRRLSHMEHKLLTYDAACYGRWVVGEPQQHLLPQVTIKTLNFYDIRDIVEHRIFSVLSYGLPLKRAEEEQQYRYVLAKNSLDLMTAILIQNGILASSLEQRFLLLKSIPLSQGLKEYLNYCLECKRDPQMPMSVSLAQMEACFLCLAQQMSGSFRIPFFNAFKNVGNRLRRRLGQLKRALQYRHFVLGSHQKHLISALKQHRELTSSQRMDHLVLHGYPRA